MLQPNPAALHYQVQELASRVELLEAALPHLQPASPLQLEQIDALLSILPGHPSRPSKLTRDQAAALEATARSAAIAYQRFTQGPLASPGDAA